MRKNISSSIGKFIKHITLVLLALVIEFSFVILYMDLWFIPIAFIFIPILLSFFIYPRFTKDENIEKFCWYSLCNSLFFIPVILTCFGIHSFILTLSIMLIFSYLIYTNASRDLLPNHDNICKLVIRNIKFVCYTGAFSSIGLLLYSHFTSETNISYALSVVDCSVFVFWLLYNAIYFYSKHKGLVISLLIGWGCYYISILVYNEHLPLYIIPTTNAIINCTAIGLFVLYLIEKHYIKKIAKENWLSLIIIIMLITQSICIFKVCFETDMSYNMALIQVPIYIVTAFLFRIDDKHHSNTKQEYTNLILSNFYALILITLAFTNKSYHTDYWLDYNMHIKHKWNFVVFSFLVLTLSKLNFKKYNSIKSALCVFAIGLALNILIVYNQDLANYSEWLPKVLKLHIIMSVCYGVALWGITKVKKLRDNEHNIQTTLDKNTLCNAEKSE